MKKIYSIQGFWLISLVLSFACLTSCKEDEEVNNGQVELLSFGPTGAKHGEEIRFIGRNLTKVEAIKLPGVTVEKGQFLEQTAELIRLVVPEAADEGKVALVTGGQEIVSKTILSFEVPVTVTSVTKQAKPGATITISGQYLNWVTGVLFPEDTDTVTQFVSKTLNELVLQVPMDAKTGKLMLFTGGTEPLVIETEEEVVITLPVITGLTPNPIDREGNLTITGTDLDLTKGVLFKGVATPDTNFISQSPTELVVKVPAEASKGTVALVTFSGIAVESAQALQFVGDLPPLAALPYVMFDESRKNGWDDWGWGGASEWNSTERVREGDVAAKKTYESNGALRMHNEAAASTSGYTELTFSVYGAAGTGGKSLKLIINEAYGAPYTFTVVEKEWTTYTIKLTNLGSPATVSDVMFQTDGWAGVVHFDHIGLR